MQSAELINQLATQHQLDLALAAHHRAEDRRLLRRRGGRGAGIARLARGRYFVHAGASDK